jgi:hypothetical protein
VQALAGNSGTKSAATLAVPARLQHQPEQRQFDLVGATNKAAFAAAADKLLMGCKRGRRPAFNCAALLINTLTANRSLLRCTVQTFDIAELT